MRPSEPVRRQTWYESTNHPGLDIPNRCLVVPSTSRGSSVEPLQIESLLRHLSPAAANAPPVSVQLCSLAVMQLRTLPVLLHLHVARYPPERGAAATTASHAHRSATLPPTTPATLVTLATLILSDPHCWRVNPADLGVVDRCLGLRPPWTQLKLQPSDDYSCPYGCTRSGK